MDSTTARILPTVADGVVTRPYALHWSMRGGMSALAVGDEVVCARFADGTGIVLCRADGEWASFVPSTLTVKGDVVASGVSATRHTHTAPQGETGGPH